MAIAIRIYKHLFSLALFVSLSSLPLHPSFPDRTHTRPSGALCSITRNKQKRSNQTHQSKTDPSARLYKKTRGAEAKLGYLGHIVTENRNGLVVDTRLTLASGTAERDAAIEMMEHKSAGRRVTLGGDRGYDTRGFVEGLRSLRVTQATVESCGIERCG